MVALVLMSEYCDILSQYVVTPLPEMEEETVICDLLSMRSLYHPEGVRPLLGAGAMEK